jgi:hypothetical protein
MKGPDKVTHRQRDGVVNYLFLYTIVIAAILVARLFWIRSLKSSTRKMLEPIQPLSNLVLLPIRSYTTRVDNILTCVSRPLLKYNFVT